MQRQQDKEQQQQLGISNNDRPTIDMEQQLNSAEASDSATFVRNYCKEDAQELRDIAQLLWGSNIRADVFQRWSQGFIFSDIEPSALVQKEGGPCAVIAPVQAYLLKFIIMDHPELQLSDLTEDKCKSLLIQAICNILSNCRAACFRLVVLQSSTNIANNNKDADNNTVTGAADTVPETSAPAISRAHNKLAAAAMSRNAADAASGNYNMLSTHEVSPTPESVILPKVHKIPPSTELTNAATTSTSLIAKNQQMSMADKVENAIDAAAVICDEQQQALAYVLTPHQFHARLQSLHFDTVDDVQRFYAANYHYLSENYGVLLFMYSVFLTKGCSAVAFDLVDQSEPLIHNTFGYGAQSLINLMLTGRAVGHVWDNEQDVGGLKLRGISEQSDIGYITLMEQLRFCTVGSFFKNPRYPVWVMGSDTHLTVLFSREKRLVSPETPSELGRRVFKSFDPEGNNFIATSSLQDVLAALNLVSEPAYVTIMQKRLDPENLGIILLNAFMDEFFPIERRSIPDMFDIMHYNGIPGSNINNKVRYYTGSAILLEGDVKDVFISNPILTCLQTKWPNIDVNWHNNEMPSLN